MRTKLRLATVFILCYLSIFLFPPLFFFIAEALLAFHLYGRQKEGGQKSFIRMMSFRPKLKHILILLIILPAFFMTYTTKPGFFFFFMVPLGYLFNKARFIGLCVLFYLFLSETSEPGKSKTEFFRRLIHTNPGKIFGVWMVGLLSMTSTLHGTSSVSCPSQKAMVGYEEVLAKNFCAGNFLARDACRHDQGSIHDAAFDSRRGTFFFSHLGNGTASPVCMYAPQKKFRHKRLNYGASAHKIIFSRADNTVYVPLMSEPKVLALDAGTLKLKHAYSVSSRSLVNAALDEKRKTLYVLSENAALYKIHLPTGNIKSLSFRQFAGSNGFGMALNAHAQMLYVTSWIGGMLARIDAEKLELVDVHRFFPAAMDVAVNEKQSEVYVARPFPPAILVLDETTLKLKKKLPAPFGARSAVFLNDIDLLAVGNYFNGTVQFFDTRTSSEVFRFYAGPRLRGFSYDPPTKTALAFSACGVYKFPLGEIYAQQKH